MATKTSCTSCIIHVISLMETPFWTAKCKSCYKPEKTCNRDQDAMLEGWNEETSFRRVQTPILSPIHHSRGLHHPFTSPSSQKYKQSRPKMQPSRAGRGAERRPSTHTQTSTFSRIDMHTWMDSSSTTSISTTTAWRGLVMAKKTLPTKFALPNRERERKQQILTLSRMETLMFSVCCDIQDQPNPCFNGNIITAFKKRNTLIFAQWAWLAAGLISSFELRRSWGIKLKNPSRSIPQR